MLDNVEIAPQIQVPLYKGNFLTSHVGNCSFFLQKTVMLRFYLNWSGLVRKFISSANKMVQIGSARVLSALIILFLFGI